MLSRQLQGRDRDFKVDSTPWERQFVHAAKSTAKNPATASAKLLLIAKTTRVQHADVRAAAHSATDSNAQSPLTRDLFEDLDEAFAALADWPAGTLGTTY
jgi:hypothetical protein